MSRFISAVCRHGRFSDLARANLQAALAEIAVTGDSVIRIHDETAGRHIQATCDVPARYRRKGLSLCLGKFFEVRADWWKPGAGVPDGSFALVRSDAAAVEAVSDPAGGRMVWTYFDDEIFVVSNSERAITLFTGRFDLDPDVAPWILSTGTRGPGRSYNRHLRLVPPAGIARLDRAAWTLDVTAEEIAFAAVERTPEEHLDVLETALRATFASFGVQDARHMLLSLSGGVDSRALAALLAGNGTGGWRSFASGTEAAAAMEGSDVAVAARVAGALGLDHRHLVATPATGRIEDLLRHFILVTEGRHDHINGLQSLATSAVIREAPADGIVRGDECFGWKHAATPFAVRQSMDLLLCRDISNFRGRLARFGLDRQAMPEGYAQRPGETLATWRDRLYATFRAPTILAALTESKAGFYDAINPLLSRRALAVARSLPDELRTDKALFRALVARIGPDVPLATRDGAPRRIEALRGGDDVRDLLRATLASETARRTFGVPLTAWLRRELHPAREAMDRLVQALLRRLPRALRRRAAEDYRLAPLRLAFRVHVATVMIDQLTADATAFSHEEIPLPLAG